MVRANCERSGETLLVGWLASLSETLHPGARRTFTQKVRRFVDVRAGIASHGGIDQNIFGQQLHTLDY